MSTARAVRPTATQMRPARDARSPWASSRRRSSRGRARAQDWAPPLQAPPRGRRPRPCSRSRPRSRRPSSPSTRPRRSPPKLSADVTMTIDIDATGHVTKVDVPKPAGHGFDEAAKAAVMQYEFSPAEIDGKPGRDPHRVHAALRAQDRRRRRRPAPPPEPRARRRLPPPPPTIVVGRGRLREKGTRNPLKDAEVSIIARPPERARDARRARGRHRRGRPLRRQGRAGRRAARHRRRHRARSVHPRPRRQQGQRGGAVRARVPRREAPRRVLRDDRARARRPRRR